MRKFFWIILTLFTCLCKPVVYAQDAFVLRNEALRDLDAGNTKDAQLKLIEAFQLFRDSNNWDMASMCLYERAIEYMNVGDLDNMSLQCIELKNILDKFPSVLVAYNYHSVASSYYSHLDSINQAIQHGWGAIHAVKQIENPNAYNIVPVWNYYNQALFYDMYFQPPLVDSVRYYLSLARDAAKYSNTYLDSIEALISIVDLEAWQAYYDKDYSQAEQMMLNVLQWIDTVALTSPNTIITERGEAYKFLAMLYADQSRWSDAYIYLTKAMNNNELRYDLEKRRVLQEVQTQYEVEKQQLIMDKLAMANKARGWLLLAACLLLMLVLTGYWLVSMRKKNIEAQLYEAALEADNMRQTMQVLERKTDIDPLLILVEELVAQLKSGRKHPYVDVAIQRLQSLDLTQINVMLEQGNKISTMDKRYVLCFAAGMTVEEIADFMSLESASVYTVRYRLRKKFSEKYPFPY